MRHLHPWPYLCHLTDERLALVILRVSTRRRHPRVKAADLIASFLAAGTTAAEYLNRRGFAPR